MQTREKEEKEEGERDGRDSGFWHHLSVLIVAFIAAAGLSQENQAFGWFTVASAVVICIYFCSLSLLGKGIEYPVAYSKQLMSKGKKNKSKTRTWYFRDQ